MKIYMLITDADNITLDNIVFVRKREDAEKLVEYGDFEYYEIVDVLNSVDANVIPRG